MSDLSDRSIHAIDPQRQAELRRKAASRLKGAKAAEGSSSQAIDALTVLHALASSPQTASDALTLLHELQVYQVELDLQAQQLQESRDELESALRRKTELYDQQPVGAFTVDAQRKVLELNRTGASMLGIRHGDAQGRSLDAFISADGVRLLRAAVARIDAGQPRQAAGRFTLCTSDGVQQQVMANVGQDTTAGQYLVSLAAANEEGTSVAA
jgi:PAS domain-containing protein